MSYTFKFYNILRFFSILLILLISGYSNAQILKSDTIIYCDTTKQISLFTKNGNYVKFIIGSDTSIRKDNSLYYSYVLDSIRNSEEYINRERIDTKIDMLYIDIEWNTMGSWSATSLHIYIYYNQQIKKNPKGFVLYKDLLKKKELFGFIDDKIFNSIVKILDENMALNHRSDQTYLLEDMNVGLSSGTRNLKLKLKKSNKVFENYYSINNISYGFGRTSFYEISRLGIKLAIKDDLTAFYNYIKRNKKTINKDEMVPEIIDQIENN